MSVTEANFDLSPMTDKTLILLRTGSKSLRISGNYLPPGG